MKIPYLLLTFIMAAASTDASVIFSDNFNSYTSGNSLPTGGNWQTSANSGGASDTVQTDTGDVFGLGAANQYLRMEQAGATASANVASMDLTMPDVGAISFDLSMPTTATSLISFRIGTANSNGNTAFALQFGTGSTAGTRIYATTAGVATGAQLAQFDLGTSKHLTVIYNNTASAVNYDLGTSISGSLNANAMDVWLDTTQIGFDLAHSGGLALGTPLTQFNFIGTQANKINDLWLDNIVVQSIPEPSTTASLALAAGFILMGRRDRPKTTDLS